ncbi:MAG: hypothetical protein Q8Q24_00625, partial [bacterium]|nr:hypothetical protein [bacterium]
VEKITNRQEALLFVQKQLLFWHEVFLVSPSPSTSRILRQIQKTLKYLTANANPRLTVENLLLSYPSEARTSSA